MKKILFTIVSVTFLIIACKNQIKIKEFDYGRVENMKYLNSYFDFEMSIPEKWIIQSKEQKDELKEKGNKLVSGDNEKMKSLLKASEINSAFLFSANQYELGSPVEYNPSIGIVAENTKNFPGIKSGSDYLFQLRKLLKQSQFKYDYIDSVFVKETINQTDFYKMNCDLNYMGITIKQTYYSTILKGFSFGIIISYNNEQQKSDLLKAINSMKFKK